MPKPSKATMEITVAEFDRLTARADRAEKEAAELRAQLNAGKSATEILAGHREADRVAALESEVTDLRAQLETERNAHAQTKGEVATLRAQDRNAASHARELLAKHGIAPIVKDWPKNLAAGDLDLWERYQAASPAEKNRMRDEYGDKLTRAAEAYDRASAR